MATSPPRWRRLLNQLRPWWNGEPDPPADPFADRMVPVRRGPKGRSGITAVAEPDKEFVSDVRCRLFWPRRA